MKKKIKKIFHNFKNILKKPEMTILPGNLAFYFLMSFIPIIAIVALISSKLITDYNLLIIMQNHVPDYLIEMISSVVLSASNYSNITILFIFYFILASNGPLSIIRASNALYNIKNEKPIRARIKSLIMTILLIALLIFTLIIPVLGDSFLNIIFKNIPTFENLMNYIPIYKVLKIVVSFIFIYLIIKLIYIIAPDKTIKGKTTSMGAIFTTISWIIATELFSFYITNIAKYNLIYGNFSNILVLLLWVYILAYLFVIGMVINNNNYVKNNEISNNSVVNMI